MENRKWGDSNISKGMALVTKFNSFSLDLKSFSQQHELQAGNQITTEVEMMKGKEEGHMNQNGVTSV